MILFLLCALAVRASKNKNLEFFGGGDNQEYCIMCGEEQPTNQMTYCSHFEAMKKIIHYIWCRECASDEQVQGKFEETCKGGMEMHEGADCMMITCPLCRLRGIYNDDVLKEVNEDVSIEMRQKFDDSIHLNHENSLQEIQDLERQLEQAMKESLEQYNRQTEEANEYDEQMKQVMKESLREYQELLESQKQQYEQLQQQRECIIRSRNNSPNKYQNKLNKLDESLLVKGKIIKNQDRDRSTAHVMMASLYMTVLFSVWIARVPSTHIVHTADKMGYLLQMFSRTYLLFIGVSGFLYTFFSKEKAWTNKHNLRAIFLKWSERDSDANISFVMYLAAFLFSIFFAAGVSDGAIVQAISWMQLLFGLFHFAGLFFQKCSTCSDKCQKRSCWGVVNDKYWKSLQKQPQEWIREKLRMRRERWRTKPVRGIQGNLTGFFSSFIPLFGFLQAIFFFVHSSELTGEQYAENESLVYVGLFLGFAFTTFFQIIRWTADIGVFTGEQVLIALAAWFMSSHSDPQTSIYAIVFQFMFLGFYLMHMFCCAKKLSGNKI